MRGRTNAYIFYFCPQCTKRVTKLSNKLHETPYYLCPRCDKIFHKDKDKLKHTPIPPKDMDLGL